MAKQPRIISASRRTDIAAFYADWFAKRIEAGYCCVPNPYFMRGGAAKLDPSDRRQVSRVDLRPEAVDVIVFWTRNPRPLFKHLDLLDHKGYKYYFQYTILGYPKAIEHKNPPVDSAIQTFRELVERVGKGRVIWRYDPIVFSTLTDVNYHRKQYAQIANALAGSVERSVISIVDQYNSASPNGTRQRLKALSEEDGIDIYEGQPNVEMAAELLPDLLRAAYDAGIQEVQSCTEGDEMRLSEHRMAPAADGSSGPDDFRVTHGSCIDGDLIQRLFGIDVNDDKDKGQREACGCITSREIGMYDTCLFGCQYCYATSSFETARENHQSHDPNSPSLIGGYDCGAPDDTPSPQQMSLFDEQ